MRAEAPTKGSDMSAVRFEQLGAVGHIVLCDPPDNKLGWHWADDLRRALQEASGSDIRALVVRAEGPNFGTGGDVTEWPGKHVIGFTSSSTK